MRWLRTTDGAVTRPAPLALAIAAVLAFVLTFGLSRATGDEGQERQAAPAATTTADARISLRSAAALPDLEAEPGPTEAELEAAREERAERRRKREAAEERKARAEAEQAEAEQAEAEARAERRRRRAERRRERAAEQRAERQAEERAAEERAAQERREAQQRRLAEQRRREQAQRERENPPTTTNPAPGGQEFDDSG
ncbi:MAG TPA: hypothetical protein VFB44_18745 [Thermoleophilaceae bacterium]|nr:hypothetical protein [Thermoleophilaceae bacterium]